MASSSSSPPSSATATAAAIPATSSSSSPSSSPNRKPRTAPPASPPPPSALLLLANEIHVGLRSFMKTQQIIGLSETCHALFTFYRNKVERMKLRWHDDGYPVAALYRLLKRQEHVREVMLGGAGIFPSLPFPMSAGCFRHLTTLSFEGDGLLSLPTIKAFAGALALNCLPSLEVMDQVISDRYSENYKAPGGRLKFVKGGVSALVEGLRGGASPNLHTLGFLDRQEGGDGEGNPDEEEREADMAALASVLEERKRLGTCCGIKHLGDYWIEWGSTAARLRLLRLLLPHMEMLSCLTFQHFSWGEEYANVFCQVGAPCLEDFRVSKEDPLFMLEALATMKGLRRLMFKKSSLTTQAVDCLIAMMRDKCDFLPKLSMLHLDFAFENDDDAERFLVSVGKESALQNVEDLHLMVIEESIGALRGLASALTQGSFPCLRKLDVCRGIQGFASVCAALGGSASAKTLEKLHYFGDVCMGDLEALGALIEDKAFPSLTDLRLILINGDADVARSGLYGLLQSIWVAGPLALETLSFSPVDDELVEALVSVLEAGALPRITSLDLSTRDGAVTEEGVMCLCGAIEAGHLNLLRDLDLRIGGISSGATEALIDRLLLHCPNIKELRLESSSGRISRML